jgi:hypothetical protein
MSSPSTNARLSRLRLCVLSGSEKDPEGGERKGGGKGRGGLLAYRAIPVSKWNGDFSKRIGGVWVDSGFTEAATSGRHREALRRKLRRARIGLARTTCMGRVDLLIPASGGSSVRRGM